MSDIRIPGGDAGASAAIGLGAVSGSGAAGAGDGEKGGEKPAAPPPPPRSGGGGGRPFLGRKMTPGRVGGGEGGIEGVVVGGHVVPGGCDEHDVV
ncbi:MAG: hypothetical protein MPK03_00560, partial [Alphaproteobacteria bacterium]|nr:hypothetical protein [Alphaproteobacteria bacterium]